MTINETQDAIVAEFEMFDDWLDRYNYIIELSGELPEIIAEHRTDLYVIKGCQSRVWVDAELKDGRIYYSADSDAIITKGIISLLVRVLNGHTPRQIKEANLYFIDRIGLSENLSPTRANGLVSMIKQMRLYAIAYDARMEQDNN